MPLPALAAGGAIGATVIGFLSRVLVGYAIVKAGTFVLKVLAFFGLAWATNEALVEPLLDLVAGRWGGIGGNLGAWMGVLQLDRVVTVIVSAYSIRAAQRVFLAKVPTE